MYKLLFSLLVLFSFCSFSQEQDSIPQDLKYREDQFYFSITYNFLGQKPSGVSQQGFSSGFHGGFLRDMPINKDRTVALAIGLGVSINSYNQNLRVSKNEMNATIFSIVNDETVFTKNKYFTYLVEVPFEFRWRNSTPTSYKFWRIYSGFKFGYVFANQAKYEGEPTNVKLNALDRFNKLQYGLTLSAGYNTWNIHMYYALNSIFDNNTKLDTGESVDMRAIKIGLIFYIL